MYINNKKQKLTFGKFKGASIHALMESSDVDYLIWMIDKTDIKFSEDLIIEIRSKFKKIIDLNKFRNKRKSGSKPGHKIRSRWYKDNPYKESHEFDLGLCGQD